MCFEGIFHGDFCGSSGMVRRLLECMDIVLHVDKKINSNSTYQPNKPRAWAARWVLIQPFSSARAGVVAKSPFNTARSRKWGKHNIYIYIE